MNNKEMVCDTCGKAAEYLRRDVVGDGYNAMMKTPLWNCEECYQIKRASRITASGSDTVKPPPT